MFGFVFFDLSNTLTFNDKVLFTISGYFARGPYEEINRYATEKLEQLMAGSVDPKDLFIVRNSKSYWKNADMKLRVLLLMVTLLLTPAK